MQSTPTLADARKLEEEHALQCAYSSEGPCAPGEVLGLLVSAARPGMLRRLAVWVCGAPPFSQTDLVVRLLASWTIGKPETADEVLTGLAVLTVRQICDLTGGR